MKQLNNFERRRGFTLVELLVVVAIFAGLGVLLVNSLFSILRSNTKSELIKEIRQNGSFALDVMTKKLTSGRNPVCDSDRVSFIDSEGEEVIFSCEDDYIASESAGIKIALTSNQTGEGKIRISLTDCSFDCETAGANSKVTISFTLSQAGDSSLQEDLAQQSFSKVISVRNR